MNDYGDDAEWGKQGNEWEQQFDDSIHSLRVKKREAEVKERKKERLGSQAERGSLLHKYEQALSPQKRNKVREKIEKREKEEKSKLNRSKGDKNVIGALFGPDSDDFDFNLFEPLVIPDSPKRGTIRPKSAHTNSGKFGHFAQPKAFTPHKGHTCALRRDHLPQGIRSTSRQEARKREKYEQATMAHSSVGRPKSAGPTSTRGQTNVSLQVSSCVALLLFSCHSIPLNTTQYFIT
jgi:hypothetical protein